MYAAGALIQDVYARKELGGTLEDYLLRPISRVFCMLQEVQVGSPFLLAAG